MVITILCGKIKHQVTTTQKIESSDTNIAYN